jgi:hypothetical protein
MTESTVSERIPHRWYARPVFFVSDVQGALRFYIDKLGFEKRWHEADGKGKVCQVNRGECELILCEDAARRDKGRLFVELTRDGLDELRRENLGALGADPESVVGLRRDPDRRSRWQRTALSE